ncbi:hypothetical protein V5799_013370, partial [Amblyomma americanum]
MSVAAVHRWGMTSFTSLRKAPQANGQPDGANDGPAASDLTAVRSSFDDDPFSFDSDRDDTSRSTKGALSHVHSTVQETAQTSKQPLPPKPKKFFKSRNDTCASSLASQTSARAVEQFDKLRASTSSNVRASKSREKNEPASKVGISWGPDDNVDFRCVKLEKSSRAAALSRDHSHSVTASTNAALPTAGLLTSASLTVAPSASIPLTAVPLAGSPLSATPLTAVPLATAALAAASVTVAAPPALQELPPPSSSAFVIEEPAKGSEPCGGNDKSSFRAPPAIRTYSRKRNQGGSVETPGMVIPVKRTASAVNVTDAMLSGLVLMVPSTNLGVTSCVMGSGEAASSSEVPFDNSAPVNTGRSDKPLAAWQDADAVTSNSSLSSSRDPEPCCVVSGETSRASATYSQDSPSGSQNSAPSSQEDVTQPSEPKASSSRSIFKSKKIFQSPKKPKAVYKMRHWQTPDVDEELVDTEAAEDQSKHFGSFDDEWFGDAALTKKLCPPSQPWKDTVTSVKCPRKARKLYTVVRNVKKAYQCHESGETQEFNDDIDYLLEGVQPSNPIGARCLSVVGLASKCMVPAFRMHLRAHGIMYNFFSALTDAPSDPSLSLCTATLFFVLSQDRLTMDLDASTLSLMLQLFESDPQQGEGGLEATQHPSSDLTERHREKVQQLCEQMQQKGHAKHLNLNRVN